MGSTLSNDKACEKNENKDNYHGFKDRNELIEFRNYMHDDKIEKSDDDKLRYAKIRFEASSLNKKVQPEMLNTS